MCYHSSHIDEKRYNFSHFTNEYVKTQNVDLKEVVKNGWIKRRKNIPPPYNVISIFIASILVITFDYFSFGNGNILFSIHLCACMHTYTHIHFILCMHIYF